MSVINAHIIGKNQTFGSNFKSWFYRTILALIMILLIFFAFVYCTSGPVNSHGFNGSRMVSIQKINGAYNFYKEGKLYFVKGGAGYTHTKELALAGGNTIICWDTAKIESTLLEAKKYNLSLIIGLDIPGGENIDFYNNQQHTSSLFSAYKKIVIKYKSNPAILAWCLGNELSFPFIVYLTPTPFYQSYNNLLNMIHEVDPHHPVSTSVMNVSKKTILNIRWRLPSLDFICINTYNKIKTIQQDLAVINFFWHGPYLISEWAPNGGWEAEVTSWQAPIENTSTKKAQQYNELYKKFMPLNDKRCLGSMVFYWGNRQEYTQTWYSIFEEDGTPTEVKEVVGDCWMNRVTDHKSPKLQYMLIDSLGAKDNILIKSGTMHSASIFFEGKKPEEKLIYRWQILKEGWQYWGRTYNNFKVPEQQFNLLTDSATQNTNFTAPLKDGPYRVFVTVFNGAGFCATANTPIYVVAE